MFSLYTVKSVNLLFAFTGFNVKVNCFETVPFSANIFYKNDNSLDENLHFIALSGKFKRQLYAAFCKRKYCFWRESNWRFITFYLEI